MLRLLVLLAGVLASAPAKGNKTTLPAKPDSGEAQPDDAEHTWLYCNTTSECQPCSMLGLNEYCPALGGYAIAQCLVAPASYSGVAEFKRELSSEEGLQEGNSVVQHYGCVPQLQFTVDGLMVLCALVAAAALALVRLRAWQLRRLGL